MYRRALLIALACAVLAVGVFTLYLRKYEQEFSGGPRVRVLVVLQPLERGKQLTESALTVREVPQAYVEDRAIRESDKAKVLGLRVGNLVQAQQTLMWTDLTVASEDHRDLSALVQPGRRAVTVPFRDTGTGAMVRPGDYVDVIGVLPENGESTGDARAARVLLQRVLVLAVGDSLTVDPAVEAQPSAARQGELTLSVSLPDAQLLALALDRGTLSLALRAADDNHTVDRIPQLTAFNASARMDLAGRDERYASRRGAPTQIRGLPVDWPPRPEMPNPPRTEP